MQNLIKSVQFLTVCSNPPTKNGLSYTVVDRQITNKWVEGDEITCRCTGSGQISGSVTNKCQNNGQWSLSSQSLPSCCKINCNFKYNLIKFLRFFSKELITAAITQLLLHWVNDQMSLAPRLILKLAMCRCVLGIDFSQAYFSFRPSGCHVY